MAGTNLGPQNYVKYVPIRPCIGLWRKIIELYGCNDRLRSDGGVQKSFENSTPGTAPELALNIYDAVTNKKQAQEHVQNPDMREN